MGKVKYGLNLVQLNNRIVSSSYLPKMKQEKEYIGYNIKDESHGYCYKIRDSRPL